MVTRLARLPALIGLFSALAAFVLAGCDSADERAQKYYEHGVELLDQGDPVKASLEFRNALKLKKEYVPALFSLGQAEQRQGHIDRAGQLYYSVTQLAPDHVEARIALANILLFAGKLDDAQKYVDEAYALAASDARVLALKAAISLKLNNRGDAVRFANDALKADPNNLDALMVLAAERILASDPNAALALLDKAPEADSNNVGLQMFKMKVLDSLGNEGGVEEVFKQLVEQHPKEASLHYGLARWYAAKGRIADAEAVLRQYADDNPDDTQAALNLVAFVKEHKGNDAARQELKTLINKGGSGAFDFQQALAGISYEEGNYSEAVSLMQQLIEKADNTADRSRARVQLARMMAGQQDFAKAEELATSVLKDDSKNVDALAVRASIRMLGGRTSDAIDDLLAALNEAPQSSPILMLLAEAYERNGATDLAEEQLAKAFQIEKSQPRVGLPYAQFLLRYGKVDQAERVLTDTRAAAPNNTDVLKLLAQVKLSKRDWLGAQEIADTLQKLNGNGDKITADQILAASLGGQQKYDEAINILQGLVDSGDNAAAMGDLVRAYMQAGQLDKAENFLNSTLQSNPQNVQALVLLASVQAANKQLDQAEATLKQAVAADASGMAGNRALAEFYVSTGRFADAEAAVRAALSHQGNDAPAHLLLAMILERSGQFEKAIAEYESLFAGDPRSAVVANNLASLLSEHRSDQASLDRAYEVAARFQQTEIPQYQDTLGWIYYLKGDYAKAVTLLKSAADKLTKVEAVQYHLGMAYKALGEKELAMASLASALALAQEQGATDSGNKAGAAMDELRAASDATNNAQPGSTE